MPHTYHDVGVERLGPALNLDDVRNPRLQSPLPQIPVPIVELELKASAMGFHAQYLPAFHVNIITVVSCKKHLSVKLVLRTYKTPV